MTAALTPLNMTVAQIEDELRAGKTVQQIAREWSEPVGNVLAVREAMNGGPSRPDLTVARQPLAGVRPPRTTDEPGTMSVGALVSAAKRSTSKRTQALGTKLDELAVVLRSRLQEERAGAEQAERARLAREQAQAEVAELERKLAEARAKIGKPARAKKPAASVGTIPCAKGCGRLFRDRRGIGLHEKSCGGAA